MVKNFVLQKPRQSGMSMIEIMIFVTIISVVLVSLTGITASMTRQMRINYNKIYATHYAEELADWLRVQKDVVGWNSFYTTAMDVPNSTGFQYCVNRAINTDSVYENVAVAHGVLDAPGNCVFNGIATPSPLIFKRSVTFSQSVTPPSNQNAVKAKILVEWIEAGGKPFQVEINTIYAPL